MSVPDLGRVFRALAFAAEKHKTQRRKNAAASPYINHPIAVASVLVDEASVTDEVTIVAALLHDTIEDTETTPEELQHLFGADVLALVAEVTDNKALPKDIRKQLQISHAAGASPQAKRIKIADKTCNVRDVSLDPPAGWSATRRREYLDWSEQVVAGCRGVDTALDAIFDAALAAARGDRNASAGPTLTEQDPHPSEPWAVVYSDSFDRDTAPRVDVEGTGITVGLKELWARHLFEGVSEGGTAGFGRFHLRWHAGAVTARGDLEGARKLRDWMFGTKRVSLAGYVAEADAELLARVAAAHARHLDHQNASEQILARARDSADRDTFMAGLG